MVGIEGIVVGMVDYGVIGREGSVDNVGNMVVGSVGRDGSVGNGGIVVVIVGRDGIWVLGNGGNVTWGSVGTEGNGGNVTLGRVGIVGSAAGVSKRWRAPRHMLLIESDTVMIIERRKQYLEKAMVFKWKDQQVLGNGSLLVLGIGGDWRYVASGI